MDELIKYIFARYFCVIALENNSKYYKWFWIILPDWRHYLRLLYNDDHKRFGRYNSSMWIKRPNRIKLWKINNYEWNKLEHS